MKIKTQIIDNKATTSEVTEVNVNHLTETTDSDGKTTWQVDDFVVHTNFYPSSNDLPKFMTVRAEGLILENYKNSNTYILRKV